MTTNERIHNIIFAIRMEQGNQNHPSGWKPIFALSSKGGAKRALVDKSADTQLDQSKDGHRISSPTEVGDEIREMLLR